MSYEARERERLRAGHARAVAAIAVAWIELGPYYAGERARNAVTPLVVDPRTSPREACHSVLAHGVAELGLLLRPCDVERLTDAAVSAWEREMCVRECSICRGRHGFEIVHECE